MSCGIREAKIAACRGVWEALNNFCALLKCVYLADRHGFAGQIVLAHDAVEISQASAPRSRSAGELAQLRRVTDWLVAALAREIGHQRQWAFSRLLLRSP